MSEPTRSPVGSERLFTGRSGRLLITLSLGLLIVNLGWQLLPPLLPTIIEQLAIQPSEAGFALSLLWGLFSLMQYPSGHLSDKLSRKVIIIVGLVMSIIGFGLLTRTTTYLFFLLSMGAIGIGTGAYIISTRVLLSDLFVARRGQAIGFSQAAGQVGSSFAGGIAAVVLAVAVWRTAFVPLLGLLLLTLILFHSWSHEPFAVGTMKPDIRGVLGRVFGTPEIRLLVAAYTLYTFTWQGVVSFLPTFLQVEKDMSPTIASVSFTLLFVVGMASMPVAGWVSDRRSRTTVAGVALLLCALGLGVVTAVYSKPVVIMGIVLFASGLMAFPPVMQAHLLDIFPETSMGGDFGAFRTFYQAIASLGPTYVGVVAEHLDYTTAYFGFLPCLLGSLILVFWVGYKQ